MFRNEHRRRHIRGNAGELNRKQKANIEATNLDYVIPGPPLFGDKKMAANTNTKVIVFGATGRTGIAVIEAALKKDYKVSAFVHRSPLPDHLTDKVMSTCNFTYG